MGIVWYRDKRQETTLKTDNHARNHQRKTLMQIINYTSDANDTVSPAKYNFA